MNRHASPVGCLKASFLRAPRSRGGSAGDEVKLEATTTKGRVRGCASGRVLAFRGIPYARPPVGRLRLRRPEPCEPWSGVADATSFGAASMQNAPAAIGLFPALAIGPQSEDCLTLNVTTPAADGERRPVLVWIHGGGFDWGASAQPLFDGTRLVERGDLVVVTVNYRLGALGFLHLGAITPRGAGAANTGLLDQIAALTWVRENISAFGGDPERVTVFGESAGAMSIAAMLAMPSASGLFRQAILQSGGLQPLHDEESAATVARDLMEELWLEPDEAGGLSRVPASSILVAQARTSQRLRVSPEWLTWRPYVDGRMLPRDPADAIRAGAARGIPLLIGTNRDECQPLVKLDPRLRPADERALRARVSSLGARAVDAGRVVAAYRRAAGGEALDVVGITSAIETDAHFRLPAIELAGLHARHERRTFMYRFDWASPAFGGAFGACHGLEVPFVFGTTGAPGLPVLTGDGPEAQTLSSHMTDAWIAFARTGEPAHAGLGVWPVWDTALRSTMRFGAECGVLHDPGGIERRAWATPDRDEAARAAAARRGGAGRSGPALASRLSASELDAELR